MYPYFVYSAEPKQRQYQIYSVTKLMSWACDGR